MDLQHFEGAVCLASFRQLWSGFSSPGHWVVEYRRPASGQGLSRKLLWCDFSLNQCCRSTDLWLLRPYGAHNLHPELRYSSNSSNDQVPGNQPIRRQHVMCNHVHSIVFACIFSHRKALFRFNCNGTPWIFCNHPVLCIIRFSCQLIFNKLLYTESVERKPFPTLTKLLLGFHGLSFEKVTVVIWRSEKGKTVEEWTGSKLRSWSWSFVPAATCACLQPLTKHWSIYAKAATIVSPV